MFQKKKLLIFLAIVCTTIVGLFAAGKITGALTYSTAVTNANSPAIKQGDFFFISNLPSPRRFNFIAYHHTDPNQGIKLLFVHRICGMPGDTIAIRDGNLYVNGLSADDSMDLRLIYQIPANQTTTVAEHFNFSGDDIPNPTDSGKAVVALTKPQVKELATLQIPFKRRLEGPRTIVAEISALYQQPWALDEFGPIQVPANQYFVLGDNRYFSQDSRFLGFIKKEEISGVILGVK
jgi:signal peptidase I